MSKELVERLREGAKSWMREDDLTFWQAADRIEALEAEVERLSEALRVAEAELEQHTSVPGVSEHVLPFVRAALSEVHYRDDEPLSAHDQAMIDAGWERFKAALSPSDKGE